MTLAQQEARVSDFPCVKGFLQMKERGAFGKILNDAASGSAFTFSLICAEGDTPGVNVSLQGAADLSSGPGIENPGNRDFLLVSCGKAVTGASGTGALSTYMRGGTKSFRVQPYYGLFGSGVRGADRIAPPTNQAMQLPLVAGNDYIHAFGRGGDTIIHYGDDGTVSTNDISLLLDDSGDSDTNTHMRALYDDIQADEKTPIDQFTQFGHSGVGKILTHLTGTLWSFDTYPMPHSAKYVGSSPDEWEMPSQFPGGQTDEAQLYYGVMLCVFDSGLPSDYVQAIQWMKSEWVRGRKLVWPDWRGVT